MMTDVQPKPGLTAADLEAWRQHVESVRGGALPQSAVVQLADALTHDQDLFEEGGLKTAENMAVERSRQLGYSAVELRLREMRRRRGPWPDEGVANGVDLSRDIAIDDAFGAEFRVGGPGVESLRMLVREVRDSTGRVGLEASLSVTPFLNPRVTEHLLDRGAKFQAFEEERAVLGADGALRFLPAHAPHKTDYRSPPDIQLSLRSDSQRYTADYFPEEVSEQAMRGALRIRAWGKNQAEQRKHLMQALAEVGAGEVLTPVTEKHLRLYTKMRILWQAHPELAHDLSKTDVREGDLDAAIELARVPPKFLTDAQSAEVFPGYSTVVVPGQGQRYRKHGVQAVYHNSSRLEGAVEAILAGGLLATSERVRRGVLVAGMSSDSDLNTGGADYVFTRLSVKGKTGSVTGYTFVWDTDVLDRADWFGYANDRWGSTTIDDTRGKPSKRLLQAFRAGRKEAGLAALTEEQLSDLDELHPDTYGKNEFVGRLTGKAHIDSLTAPGAGSNEVMFRYGLPLSSLAYIGCASEQKKQDLVDALNRAGVYRIAGRSLDDVLKVTKHVEDPSPAKDNNPYYV